MAVVDTARAGLRAGVFCMGFSSVLCLIRTIIGCNNRSINRGQPGPRTGGKNDPLDEATSLLRPLSSPLLMSKLDAG